MNWPAFWKGFFKRAAPPKVDLDEVLAELDELIPPKTIKDDMAAVYGDFVRALGRM